MTARIVWRKPAACRAWQWKGREEEYDGPEVVEPRDEWMRDQDFVVLLIREAERANVQNWAIGVLVVGDGYILV